MDAIQLYTEIRLGVEQQQTKPNFDLSRSPFMQAIVPYLSFFMFSINTVQFI